MKTILTILTLGLLTTFVSCGQPNDRENIAVITTDTLQTGFNKNEQERLEKRRKIEEKDYADSIRLDKILQDALEIANQNIKSERYIKKYIVSTDSIPVSIEINLDYHFTKASTHLIIRRIDPSAIYIDIYTKNENTFEKVLSHKQWSMEYLNDTIRDINGDGLNDFVVNCNGFNGCCLKVFNTIYLLRADKKEFSKKITFMNPTFAPKEKMIRGVCYGHLGETEMYKYKWNGEKVDTLEYVFYEKDNKGVKTGRIVISKNLHYGDKSKTLEVLNSVPKEFRKIEGYDWFTGKGYE